MIGAVLLSTSLVIAAPVSEEERERAFELADQAEQLRASGDLDGAREALAEAYQLDPNPYFLFGRGRLASEAGDCDEAIVLMREFLERYPDADGEQAARAEIEECGGTVEETREPRQEAPPEAPPPVVPEDSEPVAPKPPPPWHRDPLGGALFGTGLATAAVGIGLYAGALAEQGRAPEATTTDEYRRSIERTRSFEISGITLMAVGGSLVAGAILRYSLVGAKRRRMRDTLALGFRF